MFGTRSRPFGAKPAYETRAEVRLRSVDGEQRGAAETGFGFGVALAAGCVLVTTGSVRSLPQPAATSTITIPHPRTATRISSLPT